MASPSFTALLFKLVLAAVTVLQYFLSSFLWNSDKMLLGTFWPRFCGISVLHCPGSFLATFVLLFFSTLSYGFDKGHERLGRRGLVASSFFTALLVKRGV